MGRMWSWCSCNYRCRWPCSPSSNITTIAKIHHHHHHKHPHHCDHHCSPKWPWPHHPSSNIKTIAKIHHRHQHKHLHHHEHHCSQKWRSPPSYLVSRLATLLCSLGNCRFSKSLTCLPIAMWGIYSSIKGKLPSEEQTQRMKRLNSGRLLEKFGQSVKTPIKSQALIAQSTMYNVHPIAGEAIPQAITSALFLYRHTELQVRQLVDEDNSYNYSQSCFL